MTRLNRFRPFTVERDGEDVELKLTGDYVPGDWGRGTFEVQSSGPIYENIEATHNGEPFELTRSEEDDANDWLLENP